MRKTYLFIILFFFTSTALAEVINSPDDVIAILQQGIESKNADAAKVHIDFNKMTESFIQTTLPLLNKSVSSGQLVLSPPLSAALGSMNSGNTATQKTAAAFLANETKKFTLYGIESGFFAGTPIAPERLPEIEGGMFMQLGNISIAKKTLSKAALLSQNGDKALVSAVLYDYGTGLEYYLELELVKMNNTWVIIGLKNADDLITRLLHDAGIKH